jgi:hypothetical protein
MKKSSSERVCKSECLPRQSCLNNSLRFLFLGLDEKLNLQNKGGYRRGIARSHF